MRALLLATCLALVAGCGTGAPEDVANSAKPDWVVVAFDTSGPGHPATSMAMIRAELRAATALQQAGLGVIDGNEAGRHSYDLYFTGADAEAMWAVLAAKIDDAPYAWKRAELRDGLNDHDPVVVRP